MDIDKLYRLEAHLEVLGEARRGRAEAYRNRIAASRALRTEATIAAHPEYQVMSLADLAARPSDELKQAGVDESLLRRAAVERHLADAIMRGDPRDEEEFVALSALVPRLRDYAMGAA
ncbi:hypothetical protein EZ313_19645 [Ramlibacter henchirensis]|uniref:Uncharacterized protein n=1 Tax=Ramlibacter henchirensis TaxID=204072 RepID=A0A4Z0BMY9_9BURK|nr:hypothetical protein [Ramlibacter henchirensis]TFZ00667.1 hypothetical protein EZ313_19645 [Ramlibacter henchirensis]